ncbi:MAG: restriction endonuclease [Microthrixaceae bacterium]|nr:restriction endonuclease [Microthrixaceae bacterium]
MTGMPTWEGFMIPVLSILSNGDEKTTREIRNSVSDLVGLTDDQRTEMLPSGRVTRTADRISWAIHFLNRVEAIQRPRRATYVITERGMALLSSHPDGLTEHELKPHAKSGDEWWEKRSGGSSSIHAELDDPQSTNVDEIDNDVSVLAPHEQVEQGVARIHEEVASELLSRLVEQDPAFFEGAVVTLLLAMGYGGVGGRGATTDLTNDGGIDGVIDQDVLGLGKVYVQAKRYSPANPVRRPEVQAFVGALSGKTDRGVFITTSRFSTGAREYAYAAQPSIVLIDGQRLTELMIEYGVGVQVQRTYRVVEIDEDFFT